LDAIRDRAHSASSDQEVPGSVFQAVHGVIDAEVSWVMRRLVDPAYVGQDLREAPEAVLAAREAWLEYLAQRGPLDETLDKLVMAAKPSLR
jgi:hypothetical protein